MKIFLFPRVFQLIGWLLFVPSAIVGALHLFGVLSLTWSTETIVNDAVIIGMVLGALFIVCSKEAKEDEMTRAIRLTSLLRSIYVYSAVMIICTLFINGIAFFIYACINMVIFPIIYVAVFKFEMYRYFKLSQDEESN